MPDEISYQYDPFARRTSITYPDFTMVSFTYDDNGNRTSATDPNTDWSWQYDALGSVTGLTDSSGALAASYQYDAYGNVRAQTGSVSNPFLFTGRYWDDDIDLYQYRARWYDPDNGRFLSRDPLGPINIRQPYAYVNNNPATNVDPLGLDTWKCDSGKVSVGFLIGYERTNLRCTNQMTGETCSLLQKCWKIGALAGASLGGCGGRVFDGPATGDGFNSSGLENGWSVTAGIGGGVGVGGEVSGNTSSQGPGSELNLCGGVGSFGLEFELGGQHCSTTVLSCTRPKEPNPPTKKPPTGPGSDHADDNFSAAGRTLPISNLQSPISNYATQNPTPALSLVGQPRVGIFWHGYAEEAQALLASWGWESAPVDIDFSPTALDLPVLFIPSGGLNGLDSAPSVRARLEAFAAKGGVIIALAQQRGYEFTSLPGGQLNGYGWAEDNSCFDASLYVSEYQPFLSGFSQSTLTAGVDGFFTDLPDAAQILLNRTRDGQPGLTLYPYQSGWVAAASVYDDWGSSNHQPPADSARLLRDLLSWGVDADGPLPEFSPGMTATVPITVVNAGLLDTARVRFQVIDPDGQAVMTQTLDLPLQPGDASLQTIQVPNLPADLGIWWTQYTLLDASDNVLQPAVWHGRFAVSDPHPATGPNKDMSLSITAPTEDFVPGPATFTFHVRNFTNSSQPATVYYGLPHHTWETGNPAYGYFDDLSQSVNVPPQSEITFTHTADILTNDRLFARMTGAGFAQDAWFQVRVTPPAVYLEAQMGGGAFGRGRAAQGVVTLRNYQGAAYQVTLNMQAQDGRSGLLYQGQQTTLLQSTAVFTTPITFTVPTQFKMGLSLHK
ncbi:MAG: RHS repeat domain-containing protein, partial [Anaerolineae bacterium]